MKPPPKKRIDDLMVERGLAPSADEALRLILAGDVHGRDRRFAKAGERVPADAEIAVRGRETPYVGRGGAKLAGALDAFCVEVAGRTCADLGASTGGFTDCLLRRGAVRVFAIEGGRGQLHDRLTRDERVVSRERTDLRTLEPGDVPGATLFVVDVSFLSLRACLPVLARLAGIGADVVALVKPQFELPRERVPPGGIVADPVARRAAVERVLERARAEGFRVCGVAASVLAGGDGNQEYFVHLRRDDSGESGPPFALDQVFASTLDGA